MDSKLYQILIIYQDGATIDLLRHLLTAEGFGVVVAKDGESGLLLAKQQRPDLIILDVALDPINGLDICKSLRMLSELKRTFITFFSRQKDEVIQVEGLNAGADDFISRPINNKVLTYRIQALFKGRVRMTG
jgi:DNA-binding response OmpR family regulator